MVDRQLVSYIKEQLGKGYRDYAIKNNLLRYGYKESDVDEALNYVKHPPQKKVILISLMVVVFLLVIGSMVLIFNFLPEGEKEAGRPKERESFLYLETSLGKRSFLPGENLKVDSEINNPELIIVAASLVHEVFNADGVKVLEESQKASINQRTFVSSARLEVPEEEGTYNLRSSLVYDGKETKSSLVFEVRERVEEFDLGEEVDLGEEREEEREEVLGEGEIGRSQEETLKEIEKIKTLAEKDLKEAEESCLRKFEEERTQDSCLLEVALKTLEESLCEKIKGDDARDSCYVQIALSVRDFSLCDEITNEVLKERCNAFKG